MKKFWIAFLVVVLLVGGFYGLMMRSLSRLNQPVAIDGGTLVWRVAGSFPEERDSSFLGQLRNGEQLTLSDVIFGLYRAADDERINGLIMDLRAVKTDWAKIEEIRSALRAFQATGKPVYAYFDGAGTREYALAADADKIFMSPEANLMVLGVTAELEFMKDTLGKLGMEADFIHVGKFKSAPERMTRTEASDANREMINSIVDDRFDKLLGMLAQGRGVTKDRARQWVDRGMFDATGALAAGLVDSTLYLDDIQDHFFDDETSTFLADYVQEKTQSGPTTHTVGVIYASGIIMPGESRFDRMQGKIAGSETIVEQLESVRDDDDIDLVILRVDSPGGSALASDLIWNAIGQVQQKKKVLVSMSGLAASGGYYISCLGDSIFADPGTLTGSIGVYAGKMSRSGMYRKIGVNREFITRGENALLFKDEGGFTAGQKTLFQNQLDGFYERFLGKVAQGRDLTRDQVHAVAQGRVWTGSQGQEAGLVDGMGGFHRALNSAKWVLGLQTTDKVAVQTFGKELSPLERLLLNSLRQGGVLARLGDSLSHSGSLTGNLGALQPVLESLRSQGALAAAALLDGRPVAMMPFTLELE